MADHGTAMAATAVASQASLSTLAETARREHGLAIRAGESMLLHAIHAGEALLEARSQVEEGGWGRWLTANFPATDRTAKQYMRIARGKDAVLANKPETLDAAERIVPALPRTLYRLRDNGPAEEAEAREMHNGGASFQEIANHFGICYQTAQAWVIPGQRERRNLRLREERRLAREAKERKASKAALRRAGAAMSALYADSERMQDVLAQARREVKTTEASRCLAVAEQHYRQMRDQVVRALGAADASNSEAV